MEDVDVVLADIGDRGHGAKGLRVVDETVDPLEALDRLLDERVDLLPLLDVARNAQVLDTEVVELGAGLGQELGLPLGHDHPGTPFAEVQGHALADAFARSGDDDDLARHLVHGRRRRVPPCRHAGHPTHPIPSAAMLEGRTILITGGGSGIGRATAARAAHDGAAVAVVDRHEANALESAQLVRDAGGEARAYACDVADGSQVAEVLAAAARDLGRISGVVTAAGIFHGPDLQPAHEVTVDDFVHVLQVNLVGTFAVIKYALPFLVDGGGAIVTIASTAAIRGHGFGAGYTASKGGVDALTRLLAVQYGKHGVRANCVCPGGVDTPMTGGTFATPDAQARATEAHSHRQIRTTRGSG